MLSQKLVILVMCGAQSLSPVLSTRNSGEQRQEMEQGTLLYLSLLLQAAAADTRTKHTSSQQTHTQTGLASCPGPAPVTE